MTRARNWLLDLLVHNQAEQLRINRDVQRKRLGVVQTELPYPGAVSGSNNPTVVQNTGGGIVKGAALAAALLTAGGGGALGLAKMLAPAPTIAPAPVVSPLPAPAPVPAPGVQPAFDEVTEQQLPDGSWKEIGRRHLPLPK